MALPKRKRSIALKRYRTVFFFKNHIKNLQSSKLSSIKNFLRKKINFTKHYKSLKVNSITINSYFNYYKIYIDIFNKIKHDDKKKVKN